MKCRLLAILDTKSKQYLSMWTQILFTVPSYWLDSYAMFAKITID